MTATYGVTSDLTKPVPSLSKKSALFLHLPFVALYAAAAAWLIWLSRDQINPDGVAYIENARHWAAGRFDLAVTGWWGPLLSWVLVPAVWLGWNEVLVVKIIGAVCGFLTAVAAGKISSLLSDAQRIQIAQGEDARAEDARTWHQSTSILAFAATLALCLLMIPEPVTPDMLMTCIITWYFLFTLRWLILGRTRDIVLAGLLGGVGYLAKSYALPFVIAHLVLTAWMRRRRVRKGIAQGATIRPAIHGLAMLAVVTLPWIVTLSRQGNSPTIGCAGQYARRAFDPVAQQQGYPNLPIFDLQWPRQGRLTCWENGVETQRSWPDWPVFCPQGAKRIAYSSFLNAQRTADFLNASDRFGLMRISLVLLAACCLLRLIRGPALWAVASVLIFSAGYLPLIVYDRYLWPAWPMQLAVLISLLLGVRKLPDFPEYKDRWRIFLPWAGKLAIGLILLSLVWADVVLIIKWSGPDGEGAKYTYMRTVGGELARHGNMPLASNEWHQGLYGAYWANRVYIGQFRGRGAEEVAGELEPFGPTGLIVFDDPQMCGRLERSPLFRKIDLPSAPEAWASDEGRIAAFIFMPDRMFTK